MKNYFFEILNKSVYINSGLDAMTEITLLYT